MAKRKPRKSKPADEGMRQFNARFTSVDSKRAAVIQEEYEFPMVTQAVRFAIKRTYERALARKRVGTPNREPRGRAFSIAGGRQVILRLGQRHRDMLDTIVEVYGRSSHSDAVRFAVRMEANRCSKT